MEDLLGVLLGLPGLVEGYSHVYLVELGAAADRLSAVSACRYHCPSVRGRNLIARHYTT